MPKWLKTHVHGGRPMSERLTGWQDELRVYETGPDGPQKPSAHTGKSVSAR